MIVGVGTLWISQILNERQRRVHKPAEPLMPKRLKDAVQPFDDRPELDDTPKR